MDTQRTPDALSTQQENELICEKLLGWKKHETRGWLRPYPDMQLWSLGVPAFTAWAEAGLILDAAKSLNEYVEVHWAAPWFAQIDESYSEAETGPLAIRAAALEYIKVRKP